MSILNVKIGGVEFTVEGEYVAATIPGDIPYFSIHSTKIGDVDVDDMICALNAEDKFDDLVQRAAFAKGD